MHEQKQNHEYIQRTGEEILKHMQSNETSAMQQQFRNDLKSLKLRYTNVDELVFDRKLRMEKAVFELKKFHDEYSKTLNSLQHIESLIKNEQKINTIEKCNNIGKELEAIQLVVTELNDYVKHLYITTQPSSDSKYLTKIKSDMHEMNQKLMNLMHHNAQQKRDLQVEFF